ncbi:sensor histidine kinase [Gelidibacter sp. F63206]|uniref:sensor histidine kinase n=1 Tax=Gelidibacter sp. F63206 TaxID=2926425 RepID=UPI001FF58139|nr:histidine kinase [Gelidibacter sp. F63206]MCK0114690.1 histidine kinase [Gelidibacter sp. F63206]
MSFFKNKNKYIDLKLVLVLAGFYALFDLVLISKVLYMRCFGEEKSYFSWFDFFVYNLLADYIIVVSFMILIAISTKRLLIKHYSWVKIISIHIIFSILIGLVIRLTIDIHALLTGMVTFEKYEVRSSIYRFMYVIDLNFLIYFAMVSIIYSYYYLKQFKKAESKQRQLEMQLVNTRMKMLSSQLQPHFLFNTLNSIAVLTDIDAGKAKDTIADLSSFLREILYDNDRNTISLEKELRVLEYYLNILNIRFSDHLLITKEVDDSLLSKKVPALLLQPILENSIKHGYSYNHTDLEIHIKIYAEDKKLVIMVQNNGETMNFSHKELLQKGMGLSNINDRLSNLYGNNYFFEVRNKKDKDGVEAVVKIPMDP